jgi:hypothetical protein
MNKVLVCGSRTIENYEVVGTAIKGAPFSVDKVVHGGADGVDSNADRYAAVSGIETEVVEPNYQVYGDDAPLKRNKAMVEMADAVIAVWDGESSGTGHTIETAKEKGMSVFGRVNHSEDVGVVYMGYDEVIL